MVTTLDRFTRMLDWNLLKHFVQIAQSGSIGAAAGSLHLSQPSVSAALRRLEDSLGVQLCTRSRKGIQLTGAGHAFLKECETIVGMLAKVPAELRAVAGDLGGSILLTTISRVTSPALDAGITTFKTRYPHVELIVETGHGDQIVDLLLNGTVAVAIGFDDANRTDLRHALLLQESQQLYCGPSHPLFGKSIVDPASLAAESFVTISHNVPAAMREFHRIHGLGGQISGIADNVLEAAWLVGLGIGIGHLPEPMVAAMSPPLWPLLPAAIVPKLDIYLMWRPDLQSQAALRLIETIVAQIGVAQIGVAQIGVAQIDVAH